jgi:hypothetical protein
MDKRMGNNYVRELEQNACDGIYTSYMEQYTRLAFCTVTMLVIIIKLLSCGDKISVLRYRCILSAGRIIAQLQIFQVIWALRFWL